MLSRFRHWKERKGKENLINDEVITGKKTLVLYPFSCRVLFLFEALSELSKWSNGVTLRYITELFGAFALPSLEGKKRKGKFN